MFKCGQTTTSINYVNLLERLADGVVITAWRHMNGGCRFKVLCCCSVQEELHINTAASLKYTASFPLLGVA